MWHQRKKALIGQVREGYDWVRIGGPGVGAMSNLGFGTCNIEIYAHIIILVYVLVFS